MKKFKLSEVCKSRANKRPPLVIDEPGRWLVISDIHFPYHSDLAVEAAVQFGLDDKCDSVLINGDLIDCAQISRFVPERGAVDLRDEIDVTTAFLKDLRKAYPKGRIVFKTGNHEDRLHSYLMSNAAQAGRLKYQDWSSQLELPKLDIEIVENKRKIYMGDLTVVHGHEFNGGGGVNPARWLFLKINDCGLMGHLHRSSFHSSTSVRDYVCSVWSTGCLCDKSPEYASCNQWDWSFGTIELRGGGDFHYEPHSIDKHGQVR